VNRDILHRYVNTFYISRSIFHIGELEQTNGSNFDLRNISNQTS